MADEAGEKQETKQEANTGEVRDIRSRNRGVKIAAVVVIILLLLVGAAIAVWYFVFYSNIPRVEYYPNPSWGNLISYNQSNNQDGERWANEIDTFLAAYTEPSPHDRVRCTGDYMRPLGMNRNKPCFIDVTELADCSSRNSRYGYIEGRGTPCVILKLRKVLEFDPEPYTKFEEIETSNMPRDLIQYIIRLNNSRTALSKRMLNTTWITCEGESTADKENIGVLNYFNPGFHNLPIPRYTGIPYMYFPYLEQEGYMDPFLFVKFLTPNRNVVITVKCQPWAKNIDPERASVTFQLRIE